MDVDGWFYRVLLHGLMDCGNPARREASLFCPSSFQCSTFVYICHFRWFPIMPISLKGLGFRALKKHFPLQACPADVFKATADCFRGMWCWGLDEAAGMVLSNKKVHVSCRSLAYVMCLHTQCTYIYNSVCYI